ncbi:hypothetical protein OOJ91_12190 [Micromonospora lupini]|uniref:hypothetical protein n=1 Tax=Micromonospora lupini TaxID=285679 RepID=UPI002258DF5D|nr:hypothetical protein [Micromonospora lupini]MCX5066638.1 hypothetical protein [Micromonospora lupini]
MTAHPGRWKVWFHRSRAVVWMAVGALSFPLGWANSVVLVWVASLNANVVTDIGAAEAADDRNVTARLDRIERLLNELVDEPEEPRTVADRLAQIRAHQREHEHLLTRVAEAVADLARR